MRRTLGTLTDADIRQQRAITVLFFDEPVIAGRLIGSYSLNGQVSLRLQVLGLRVDVEPLPADTECEVA